MLFGARELPAPAMAAPMPPRSPTSTTRALGSRSICRRSAESVLVSLPVMGTEVPSESTIRSNTTSITPDCCRVAGRATVIWPRILLPAGMMVTEYALLSDRVLVWSIARGTWTVHVVPITRDSVRRLVKALPSELQGVAPAPAPALEALYDVLLRPLGPAFEKAERVAVIPDRDLHAVPFAALRRRESARYAVEDHEFRTVSSAAFLLDALARHAPGPSSGDALVIGNPVVDPAIASSLPSLVGAEREARLVARVYGESPPLLRENATRERILSLLPGASIVHFAGHAVFDAERPERSYLAVASRRAGTSGVTAAEIAHLRLSKTQVVILSACSTMNPRPSRAGGVAGLAYSFLRAGAPSTVSTLWDVDDADVPALLVRFHQELRQGKDPAAALRGAQLAALRAPSLTSRVPPWTWAAFTYTGP